MLSSVSQFFFRWYIEDSKSFWNGVEKFIRIMDRDFGVVANIYNWTSPLYGDYSYIGKVAGPIFRTMRIFIGAVFYLGVIIFCLGLYMVWIALPAIIAFMIIQNLEAVVI